MAGFASVTVHGADKISAAWQKAAATSEQQAYVTTKMYTQLLTTSVKAHASGRPGPRTITGDYRRSITGDVERKAGTVIGIVGTTRPQGARLELGYSGTDSLGRRYDVGPFPHFRPALSKVESSYIAALGGIVRSI